MQLTREKLKNIIRETLFEDARKPEGQSSAEFRQSSVAAGKAGVGGGITDEERHLIAKVAQDLLSAARKGNLMTSPQFMRYLGLMMDEAVKLMGKEAFAASQAARGQQDPQSQVPTVKK